MSSLRDRFLTEYAAARVNLRLTEAGYERYVVDLYPDRLAALDLILHLMWAGLALFFALRTSNFGLLGTLALSLGGMIIAFIIASLTVAVAYPRPLTSGLY